MKNANKHNTVDIIIKFLFSISTLSPIYKNIAFSEEKEWRAYISYPYPSGDNSNEALVREFNKIIKSPAFSELKSYVRDNKIIFYTEFNWANIDWIKEIYIGPKCEADKDDIKKLLATCNVKNSENIRIEKSRASYR